jgi:hypothetical protein
VKKESKQARGASAKPRKLAPVSKVPAAIDPTALLADLRSLIQSGRQRIASAANSTFTVLCWQVGRRLLREDLEAGRAAYGKQILATVSQELMTEFGAGFSARSIEPSSSARASRTTRLCRRCRHNWAGALVFRDPYLLDLLGLKGAYSERDLESAILKGLERAHALV